MYDTVTLFLSFDKGLIDVVNENHGKNLKSKSWIFYNSTILFTRFFKSVVKETECYLYLAFFLLSLTNLIEKLLFLGKKCVFVGNNILRFSDSKLYIFSGWFLSLSLCVCVCVYVREKERESVITTSHALKIKY